MLDAGRHRFNLSTVERIGSIDMKGPSGGSCKLAFEVLKNIDNIVL